MPVTTDLVFDWDEEDGMAAVSGFHTTAEVPLRFRSDVTLQDIETMYFLPRMASCAYPMKAVKQLARFKKVHAMNANWAYPIAHLHVAITFLMDVRDQLQEVIVAVEKQTNTFKVPIYDIFLPTEADFNRLRILMGFFTWMFPEALAWPEILREQIHTLPLEQLSVLEQDFKTVADSFGNTMHNYQNIHSLLLRWIKRVDAERERRKLQTITG